ncbi:MAG: TonB-dependent receptor, partial [Hyphomicrobium sp.]
PSRDGRPSSAPIEQFFGNPRASFMDFTSHVGTATVEHMTDVGIKIRNVTSYGDYDKFYQNVFASGSVSDAGTVNIAAYNNALVRQNFFNQTDVTGEIKLGNGLKHTWLVGTEIGYQETDSFRFDANFNSADGPGSIAVPFGSGVTYAPMFFNRLQNNARNHTELGLAGVYVQDQLSIGRYIDVIGGIRFDHFNLDYTNEVDGSERGRIDNTFSPRAGIVLKPLEAVSVYASYSESFLPFSGDQFTALSAANADLSPEKFTNHEIGVKWDILPRLAFTAALFKLDRENTTAAGPIAGTLVQTGATETKGLELALTGYVTDDWQVSAGFAHTRAEIASTTTAAPAGRDVPLVPDNTFSLWNRYQLTRMFGVGVGVVHRTEMFTSISNTVELPSFTRVDAALFVNLTDNLKAQINVENLLDETYYTTAHNDNNITPGSPRAFFVTVTSNF